MTTTEVRKTSLMDYLESKGVSRRTFLKFCGGIAAAMGLSSAATPKVAEALEIGAAAGNLVPVVWLESGSCSGCTESLAQIQSPDVATIVLDYLSVNYSETLSAAAGWSLEKAKEETIEAGGYILVYEGAVMTGWDGNAFRVADQKGIDCLAEAAASAAAVLAVGSCAVDGGWCAAKPNPAGAMGVQKFLKEQGIETPVINLPACPVNPEWIVEVVVQYILLGTLPELNKKNQPKLAFGSVIHDNCPRRGHFENGEFVYKFGSEEEAKGYCLYAMGCKGPYTYSNCPTVRWNDGHNWCVECGAPCIGCATVDPSSNKHNWVTENAPFQKRFRDIRIGNLRFQPFTLSIIVTGVVAVCAFAHSFGMKHFGRTAKGGGASFETMTDYERKHGKKGEEAADEAEEATEEAAAEEAEDAAEEAAEAGADQAAEAEEAVAEEAEAAEETSEGGDE